MDREIAQQLKQRREDAIDAVRKELAWQEEKCRIALHKMHSRCVNNYSRTPANLITVSRQ